MYCWESGRRTLRSLFMVAIIINLEVLLIMSMAQSVELVDSAIIHAGIIRRRALGDDDDDSGGAQALMYAAHKIHGESCGLVVAPLRDAMKFVCWDAAHDIYTRLGSPTVLSIGFALVAFATVPLSLYDLDANILVQQLSFIISMCIIFGCWIIGISILRDKDHPDEPAPEPAPELPMWPERAVTQLLGTCFFNFNYVFFLPTWANERKPRVGINWGVWLSTSIALGTFVAVGVWGALTYSFRGLSNDMLMHLAKDHMSAGIGPVTSLLFPIVVNMSGIPVLSILIRYNLEEAADNGFMPRGTSFFLAHVLPWILLVPINSQNGMSVRVFRATITSAICFRRTFLFRYKQNPHALIRCCVSGVV